MMYSNIGLTFHETVPLSGMLHACPYLTPPHRKQFDGFLGGWCNLVDLRSIVYFYLYCTYLNFPMVQEPHIYDNTEKSTYRNSSNFTTPWREGGLWECYADDICNAQVPHLYLKVPARGRVIVLSSLRDPVPKPDSDQVCKNVYIE